MAIEKLLARIRDNYSHLPPQQQKLADYFLECSNDVAFLSAHEISRRTGVGVATVVRFAQSLGYKGFDEIRLEFRELAIRNQVTPFDRLSEVLQNVGELNGIVARSFKEDIANLDNTIQEFSPPTFQRVVEKICSCRKLFLVGFGSCYSLTYFLYFHLKRLSLDVELVTSGGSQLFETLAFIEPSDLVLLISFPRYSTDSLNTLNIAAKCRASSVLISDSLGNRLAKIAGETLLVKCNTTGLANSFVPAMALCNALVLAVGLNDRDRSTSSLKKLDIIKSENNLYI